MKIDVNENRDIILKEVYSGVILETKEGNKMIVCMRDDTFEINVLTDTKTTKDINNFHRVDMKNGTIEKL